jgi:hypothetical protein
MPFKNFGLRDQVLSASCRQLQAGSLRSPDKMRLTQPPLQQEKALATAWQARVESVKLRWSQAFYGVEG